MNFDYYSLKKAANDGVRLGNWKGKPVFACSAGDLENRGNGAFYILYDDDNEIVGKDGKHYYAYGSVDSNGNVSEFNSRRRYSIGCDNVHDHAQAAVSTSTVPGYDNPVGDVKLEIDVEKTLEKARTMTIDDLLVGFNFGLEEAKG